MENDDLSHLLKKLQPETNRNGGKPLAKDIVAQYYEHLKAAQERGCTWHQLAKVLTEEKEIQITGDTLRKYMAMIRQEKSPEPAIPKKKLGRTSPRKNLRQRMRETYSQTNSLEDEFSNL